MDEKEGVEDDKFSSHPSSVRKIRKRDGRVVEFAKEKITNVIFKAAEAVGGQDKATAEQLADKVLSVLEYKFDESTGIMYKYYHGDVTLEVIISSWEYAIDNNVIPRKVKGFILDCRDANLKKKISETSGMSDFFNKHRDIFRNLKVAIITEKPDQVVIPMVIESEGVEFFPRPFFTEYAAVKWILKG